jgi:CRP-like cAMP-binding protein
MNNSSTIENILSNSNFFKNSGKDFLGKVIEASRLDVFSKGQVLFIHEDKAESFFIVKKGWVKLFRETLDGSQAVVDILSTHHVFGETSLFHDNLYPYSAEAVERTEIIRMPLSLLKAEIKENPSLALSMLSTMARYRRQQDQELEHRTLQNASQRIGCFLLRLTDQSNTGPAIIHLPYDKTLVASRLGMQPETFSRALTKLKNATGIKINGASVELENLSQLSEYACSACSSEFPCKDLKTCR